MPEGKRAKQEGQSPGRGAGDVGTRPRVGASGQDQGQVGLPAPASHLLLQDPVVEIADKDAQEAKRQAQPVGHQRAAGGHETPGGAHGRRAHSRDGQRRRRRQLESDIADRRPHRSCMRPPLRRAPQSPPQLPVQGCRGGTASETNNHFLEKNMGSGNLAPFPGGQGSGQPEYKTSPSRCSDQASPRTPMTRRPGGCPRKSLVVE